MRKIHTDAGKRWEFDSLQELKTLCDKNKNWFPEKHNPAHAKWAGDDWAGTWYNLLNGNDDLAKEASRQFDSLANAVKTERRVRELAPVGGHPIVPAALAGHPNSMQRHVRELSQSAPIRVVVSVAASWDVKVRDMVQRGTAIAVLVSKMAESRPVELWASGDFKLGHAADEHAAFMVPLQVVPVSLSRLCGVLGNPGFSRQVLVFLAQSMGGAAPWVPMPCKPHTLTCCGVREQDLYIPALRSTDPLLTDPVGFIQRTLEGINR